MIVHVFDVEHGSCNAVIAPSGELILIGCGHNDSTGWRPSDWLRRNNLEVTELTITNVDKDNVSDLPNVRRQCKIRSLSRNRHLTPDWVRQTKAKKGMGPGLETLVSMMGEFTSEPTTDWGGMRVERFSHPPELFDDEKSLSLVTFVQFGGVRIIFPGDLTRQAWKEFLEDTAFLAWLISTNIFVASYNGRIEGYCPEVFDKCHPSIILVSDMSIRDETQQVDYSQHAKGVRVNNGDIKKVLTTRTNGKITIEERDRDFSITAEH